MYMCLNARKYVSMRRMMEGQTDESTPLNPYNISVFCFNHLPIYSPSFQLIYLQSEQKLQETKDKTSIFQYFPM